MVYFGAMLFGRHLAAVFLWCHTWVWMYKHCTSVFWGASHISVGNLTNFWNINTLAERASRFSLSIIVLVADQLGSCSLTTLCLITYVYTTWNTSAQHYTVIFHPECDVGGKWPLWLWDWYIYCRWAASVLQLQLYLLYVFMYIIAMPSGRLMINRWNKNYPLVA